VRRTTLSFGLVSFLLLAHLLLADEKFLGAQSCSTSGCHGGAGEKSRQSAIWSQHDFHSRAYATLTTGRSARLAEALNIEDAAKSARCTSCHAPMAEVGGKVTEGVSCENCHGPAESWLRSHTRPDYTHADRVTAGMRDLKNLPTRANACVACHQTVETDLLKAGHPELIFELDGQAVSMPKHWREREDWNGAQAWFVGQTAALREMNWQLSREPDNEPLRTRRDGLAWVLQRVGETGTAREWLAKLATTSNDFRDANVPRGVQARRAERLVIALERLALAAGEKTENLRPLFALVQSLPDFEPEKFAKALEGFRQATGL